MKNTLTLNQILLTLNQKQHQKLKYKQIKVLVGYTHQSMLSALLEQEALHLHLLLHKTEFFKHLQRLVIQAVVQEHLANP